MSGRHRTPKMATRDRQAVLDALAQGHSITKACELAGVERRGVYGWRVKEPEFAQAFDEALERGNDALRDEIRRRGVDGWDEPVFYQGEQCGAIRKYSDRMLELQAKARMPYEYRERVSAELTGAGGGPIRTQDVAKDEQARLEQFYAELAGVPLAIAGPESDTAPDGEVVH